MTRTPAPDLPAPEFSRPLRVAELSGGEETVSASATEAEREALARRYRVRAVEMLRYVAMIAPEGDGWKVSGVASARIVQGCVVTLEDVAQEIEERFARVFLPGAPPPEEVEIRPDEEEDPPEPLGRMLDPAEMAAEAVALVIEPYPRAPGVRFEGRAAVPEGAEAETENRPFAKLAALRERLAREGRED